MTSLWRDDDRRGKSGRGSIVFRDGIVATAAGETVASMIEVLEHAR